MNTEYTKDGIIKVRKHIALDTEEGLMICPPEEVLLAHGWVRYVKPQTQPYVGKNPFEAVQKLVIKQFNERTDISNNEALEYMVLVYAFDKFIGIELPQGKVVTHNGKLWRVRQTHIAQAEYAPSLDTASLWEVINKEHEGTLEDPIPYTPPMEIFEGKYYIEDGKVYRCTRNSEVAMSHNLSDIVGLYVEEV